MDNTDKAEQVLPQWELKKENVAPARKGVRSISSLDEQLKAREGLRGLTVNEDLKLKEERKGEATVQWSANEVKVVRVEALRPISSRVTVFPL